MYDSDAPAASVVEVPSVELRCGGCGAALGRVTLPPVPPFASLPFELRTVLKPVLRYAARHAPSPAAGALLVSYLAGDALDAPGFLADGLKSVTRCASCEGLADLVLVR